LISVASAIPSDSPTIRQISRAFSPAVPACACSPYRVVYDTRRAHTAVTHPEWTDGHSHNDALRIAAKEVLKDLWRAARDYHHGATA